MSGIRLIIFDWGDTLMRDFPEQAGPMAYWPEVQLMPGAVNLLDYLHGRFACCVASNAGDSDAELLRKALERVEIAHYFNMIVTSKKIGCSKPDPLFFERVCTLAGFRPQETASVGNDYDKDIVPARSAGLFTVWYLPTGERTSMPGADVIVRSLDELIDHTCKMM